MKKRILGALTALMVLSFGITANAASITASDASSNTVTVEDNAVVTAVTTSDGVALETSNASQAQVESVKSAISTQISNTNVTVRKVLDITAPAGFVEGTPTTVTLTVSGVDTSKGIVILHVKADGTSEILSANVSGNTISFVTTSFSPFAILETEAKSASSSGSGDGWTWEMALRQQLEEEALANANSGVVTSPKTGESANAVLILVAAAAACGAVAAGRKYAAR